MKKNGLIILLSVLFLAALTYAYSNHFTNGFYFDDSHTIKNNKHIRDIGNIPSFFTTPETMSNLPGNRAYRPLVTTSNAIDYWLAGNKYDPFYFHRTIYFFYILQLILMFFVFKNILNITFPHRWNQLIALCAVAFYAFHTANAETINYIIARSDSLSTFFIVAALLMYQIQKTRSLYLYLIPLVLALFTKQTGAVFPLLLFFYIFLFEEQTDRKGIKTKSNNGTMKNRIFDAFKKSLPAFIVGIGLFLFNQMVMSRGDAVNKNVSVFEYFITQIYVITRYIGNFILPTQLSVDPDITIISTLGDHRVFIGIIINLLLIILAIWAYRKMITRPITYGVLWFYIALAPTSSFIARFQISNDHRTFFPYIGLVLALAAFAQWQLTKNEEKVSASPVWKFGIPAFLFLLFGLHAYGVQQRNEVWSSERTLWFDMIQKSPKNANGYVNYGLVFTRKDNFNLDTAYYYFNKALQVNPKLSIGHVNMAYVKREKKYPAKQIEDHYKKGQKYGNQLPSSYMYYADWLVEQGRPKEAKELLQKGLRFIPNHDGLKKRFKKAEAAMAENMEDKLDIYRNAAKENPGVDSYLELSDVLYNAGRYKEAIKTCEKILAVEPDNQFAHNNQCCSYNKLKQWDKGIAACKKALAIDPDFGKAKANLDWAINGKAKEEKEE